MKTGKRTLLLTLLSLLLILQLLPVSAAAPEQVGYSVLSVPVQPTALFRATDVDFSVSCSFYDQLQTEDQKALYTLFRNTTPDNCTVTMPLSVLPSLSVPAGGPDQAFINSLNAAVTETIWPAAVAALMDDPMLFWCDNTVQSSFEYRYSGSVLTSVTLKCSFLPGKGITAQSYPAALSALQNVLNSFSFPPTATRYEMLRQFHDVICSKAVYDLDAPSAHSAYGALVDGRAVCEGYAAAFKLLCDTYQIPCMTIFGYSVNASGEQGYHAWNVVRMENGNWYGVDVTWDDAGSPYDDFFLIGSNTVPSSHFEALPFGSSHQSNADYFGNGAVVLQFPTLSETAFRFPKYDMNLDGFVDSFDIVSLLQYLSGSATPPAGASLDLNGDGVFGPADGTVLLQYLSGMLS